MAGRFPSDCEGPADVLPARLATTYTTAPIRKFPQFRNRASRGHLGCRARDKTRGARGRMVAMSRGQ
eukprot:1000700-Pyramimonas_sp.AAC.1